MAIPVLKLPIDSTAYIKQGDTIPKLSCSFAAEDVIDITNSTIKVKLFLGTQLVYTASSGSGITHINAKAFEIDNIQQTIPFPEGTLKGDLQITDANGSTFTYFNIEVEIIKEYA